MTDFNDMLQRAKQMQQKMKEAQDEIKNIQVEGVSGGNLVILFAYLIIDIKNGVVPKTLIDYFPSDLITKSLLEIKDDIINLANAVITPSKSVVFSDLDFYIIKNSNYIKTTQSGGAPGVKRKAESAPDPDHSAPSAHHESLALGPGSVVMLQRVTPESLNGAVATVASWSEKHGLWKVRVPGRERLIGLHTHNLVVLQPEIADATTDADATTTTAATATTTAATPATTAATTTFTA